MKRLEQAMVRLPDQIKYPLKKMERPLKRIRNFLPSYTPKNGKLFYKGYDLNYPQVSYYYQVEERTYESRLFVDAIPQNYFMNSDPQFIRQILLHIGLSFVPEFFKLDNFETVYVDSSSLCSAGEDFFENFYIKGLAEFRYRNALPIKRPIKVVSRRKLVEQKLNLPQSSGHTE